MDMYAVRISVNVPSLQRDWSLGVADAESVTHSSGNSSYKVHRDVEKGIKYTGCYFSG